MFLLLVCHTCLLYTAGPPALVAIIVVLEARRVGGPVSCPSGNAGGTPPPSTMSSKSKKLLWWRGRACPVNLCPQRILTPAPPPPLPPPHIRHRPTASGRHHPLLSPLPLLLLLLLPLLPLPRGAYRQEGVPLPRPTPPPLAQQRGRGPVAVQMARVPIRRRGWGPPPPDNGGNDGDAAFFTALVTISITTPLSYPPKRNAVLPLSTPHPDWDGRTTYSDGGCQSLPPVLTPPYCSTNGIATTTLWTQTLHLLLLLLLLRLLFSPHFPLHPGSIRVASCAAAGGGGPRGTSPDDGRDGQGIGGMIQSPFWCLSEDSEVRARK